MSTSGRSTRRNLTDAFRKAAGLPVPPESLEKLMPKFEKLNDEIPRALANLQQILDQLAAVSLNDSDSPVIDNLKRMRGIASQHCQELHTLMMAMKAKIAALEAEEAAKRIATKLRKMEMRLTPRLEAAFKAAAAKKAEQAEAAAKAEQAAKAKAVVVKAKRKIVEFYCDGPDGRELVMCAKVLRKSSRENE